MLFLATLQISLRASSRGRGRTQVPLRSDSLPHDVSALAVITCTSPQVVNLRGDACVTSSAACPAGSTAVDGRCKCGDSSPLPNLAGTGCVAYGECGQHTTWQWSTEDTVLKCSCSEWAGFAMNDAKTGCVCATGTPVYDPASDRCIAVTGTCQGKNYVVNAAKTACECPTTKILHIEGTCDDKTCGTFLHEVLVSAGICGCSGEWPILDRRGKRCIKTSDYCSEMFEEAINITTKKCVDMYEKTQCKRVSLNLQKCLDSCSESGATDLTGTNFCTCKADLVMKDATCVAASSISCPKPNFFHVDGQCNAMPCGSSIIAETLIKDTNICQCNGGLPYFGQCYSDDDASCAEGYVYFEGSGQCISTRMCTDVIGGVVGEDEGTKYCECASPKVYDLSEDRCIDPASCPVNSTAAKYSCECNEGFSKINGACVTVEACAEGKIRNLARNGCVTEAQCASAGGYVQHHWSGDTTILACECDGLLGLERDKCVSWLPGKCGGNARVTYGEDSLVCACVPEYHVENGVCVRGRETCASPSFQHVDGSCSAIACGSAGITGEIAGAAGQPSCKCDAATPFLNVAREECVAACGTQQLVDRLDGKSPVCVTLCPYDSPHEKSGQCVSGCTGMLKASPEKLCVMNKGKLAAAVAVPVIAVLGAAGGVAAWMILKKKGKACSLPKSKAKLQQTPIQNARDGQIFMKNPEQFGTTETNQANGQQKRNPATRE